MASHSGPKWNFLVTNAYFLCAYSYVFFCEFVCSSSLLIFAASDKVGFNFLEFIIYSG